MKFAEIQEACWSGYRQAGMKKKGDRQVPNCVPVEEVRTGPEMSMNELLYTAAAKAMRDASREGIDLDYEDAIQQASKIYGIPYTPSQLPKLQAQLKALDARIAPLKQQLDLKKQQRKQQKYGVAPAVAQPQGSVTPATGRIKPATKTLEEEYGDPFIDNAARELLAMVLMFGVPFAVGVYMDIRNKIRKYQGREIIDALERKGVTMNRQTYAKVKPVLDRFDQAIRDDDGAEAKALAKQIEQMIVMGKLSAPEPKAPDTALAAKEKELSEDLKKWFREKWVRFGPDGKIRGDCARGSKGEGKPKCLPQAKAHALGKKGRASAAAKKRREDPNPERRGPARNVATKVKEQHDWDDADEFGMPGSEFFPEKQPQGHYKVYYMTATDHKLMGRYATQDEAEQRVRELKAEYPDNKFIVFASQRGMAEAQTDYQKRRQRERDVDAGCPVKPLPKNPRTDYQKRREQQRREQDMGEAVTLDRNRVPDYPRDPATIKHRTDTAKAILSDPKSDPESRREASRILATIKQLEIDEGWKQNVATGVLGATMALGAVDPAKAEFANITPAQLQLLNKRAELTEKYTEILIQRAKDEGRPIDPRMMDAVRIKAAEMAQRELQKQKVNEKQDACYRKVKSRYKVWPSAYASGALVQCRKKGAANWGTGGKKK